MGIHAAIVVATVATQVAATEVVIPLTAVVTMVGITRVLGVPRSTLMLEDMGPTMATDTAPAGVLVSQATKVAIGGTEEMRTQVGTPMATATIGGPAWTQTEVRAEALALPAVDVAVSKPEVASSG